MNTYQRPLSVTILSWVLIAIGAVGSVYHFRDLSPSIYEGLTIELTELWAVVAGVGMLRGHNWARWAALAWIVFHVYLSLFHRVTELAVHAAFCAVFAWILFRPPAARYFRKMPGS